MTIMKRLKNLVYNIRMWFNDKKSIKITLIFFLFFLIIKQIFIFCNIFVKYFYIIDTVIYRLGSVFFVLMLLYFLLNISVVKDIREEMSIFEIGPTNKSLFLTYLRKYHYFLLLMVYLFYSLAVTYFVTNSLISYLLGLISFFILVLYLVQFVVYTKAYVSRSFKPSFTNKMKTQSFIRTIVTSSSLKKLAPLCLECVKGALTVGGGLEIGYKLTHGGFNDVSPWRQVWLNNTFPEDKTKIWTESKAAMAMHNRAMGKPHNDIYDTVGETIQKSWPKK